MKRRSSDVSIAELKHRIANKKRSETHKKKKNGKIDTSKHRDDYISLMKMGWSVKKLEAYAMEQWKEKISGQTFATYRRDNIPATDLDPAAMYRLFAEANMDETIDQANELLGIINYLKARIGGYASVSPAKTLNYNEPNYIRLLLEAIKMYTEITGKMPSTKVQFTFNDISTLIEALPADERKKYNALLVDLNTDVTKKFGSDTTKGSE